MISIFFKYFIKSYFSWYIFLLIIVVPNNIKANDAIIFGTMQKIGNLNPFSYTSYPAELIVKFTTERLIKRVCYDYYSPQRGYMPVLINHEKLFQCYDTNASLFYLTEMKKGISFLDIYYSIKQINRTPFNRYHKHILRFYKNKIRITYPEKAAFSKAASALTFPIIKTEKLTPKHLIIENGDIMVYNTATTGLYCLKSIHPNKVELEGRNQYYRPLIFKIFYSWEQFIKNIIKGKIHVALGISTNSILQVFEFDQYSLEETDDLKSFTYFGFNYNTPNSRIRKLFGKLEFRKAFAFATCKDSDIREKLYTYGETNDHTFDHILSMRNYPIDYMYAPSGIIEGYIQSNIQAEDITIHIMFKPDFIFGQQLFNSVIRKLNHLFLQARIQFKPYVVHDVNEFDKMKKNRNFEMIFDTFTYGQNQLRYIEFLNPENSESNFLNCNIFKYNEIQKYKKKMELRDEFLLRINKELPVFVLGTFKRMNAISKRIIRKNSCQVKNERSLPFSNIHEWEISTK